MKLLGVSLALCTLVSLSPAVPLNSTSKPMGLCQYGMHNSSVGGFVLQCDDYGNFLPQQCCVMSRYCWCVDVMTGQEIPNTRTPLGSVPVNCDGNKYMDYHCPDGWAYYNKRCFMFIDSPKTWPEAESYCLFESANLVSIHSYEENHFVQTLTRGYSYDFPETWIGGQDAVYPCFWMWSDGSNFRYGDWFKDYNMERTEHCLKMNYGYEWKWNYASCKETLPFICAKMMSYHMANV